MMPALLDVKNLKKYFKTPAGFLHAVDDITFTLEYGKTLGVVGESAAERRRWKNHHHLTDATSGQVFFEGRISRTEEKELKAIRKKCRSFFKTLLLAQIRASPSPGHYEPLIIQGKLSRADSLKKCVALWKQ
jgi:peptide/nickel transport system ATP-binding protein